MMVDSWLMYLRKSRQDDPRETVQEVLKKHEDILQDCAVRQLGHRIPESAIYREVVSGESLSDRVEIKKVLDRLEDPHVRGVFVVDPQRLSRGNLQDCGRLIDIFRFTNSRIVTPTMIYSLDNKMDRRFFQDELLRGRDYLEYTKEILTRGRIAAVKRGCFIGQYAPYGYKKIKRGEDHTLEISEPEASVVRLIFSLYTNEDRTPGQIAAYLNSLGVQAPRGDKWPKATVRVILRNAHYAGYVVWNRVKRTPVLECGEIVTKRLLQPTTDVIMEPGKHAPIIDADTWEKAQHHIARNPRVRPEYELSNPYSGVLVCAKCGHVLYQHRYKKAAARFECRGLPGEPRCYMSASVKDVEAAILQALEEAELPALQVKAKQGDDNARRQQENAIQILVSRLAELLAQEDRQYELLETGRYTQELFDRRNTILRGRIDDCKKQLEQARKVLPAKIDYAERVTTLTQAIEALKDAGITPAEKNRFLRAIVDRIEFTGSPPLRGPGAKKGRKKGQNAFTLKVFLRL